MLPLKLFQEPILHSQDDDARQYQKNQDPLHPLILFPLSTHSNVHRVTAAYHRGHNDYHQTFQFLIPFLIFEIKFTTSIATDNYLLTLFNNESILFLNEESRKEFL